MNPMNWFEEFVYYYNLFAVMVSFPCVFTENPNLYGILSFCFLLILLLTQFMFYARQVEKDQNPKKFNPLKFWNPSSRQNEDSLKNDGKDN